MSTNIITTKELSINWFSQINELWNEEYPVKLKNRFSILLDGVTNYNHYIIEDENYNVKAWAVDFEKETPIRFSIIVSKQHKGNGLGKTLIDKLKQEHQAIYGWVIDHNEDVKANGEKYQSPMPFYLKHGFEIMHDERIDNEMLRAVKIKWSKK